MTSEERISKQMRALRHEMGLTQADLAKRVGAHPQQIYRYETGTGRIPAAHLAAIAQVFSVPMEVFFDDPDRSAPFPVESSDVALQQDVRTVASLVRGLMPDRRRAVIDLLRSMSEDSVKTD